VQARVDVLEERGAGREREQLREEVAERAGHADGAVGAADGRVHVQAERVVAPDDVAQDLVVAPVVRRVDDPLLLPRAPRVRAGVCERNPMAVRELEQLRAPLAYPDDHVGERVALARADLGLGGDQLAGEHPVQNGAPGGRVQVFEAVDEIVRLGIEERELLLDREREVVGRVEPLPS
jgi:hypothetical protein